MDHTEGSGENRMEYTTDKDKLVAHCKIEILQMIEAEVVPAKVKDFGDLHNYCDANTIGFFCEPAFNDWLCEQLRKPGEVDMPQGLIDLMNAVQEDLNTWIASGIMARERAEILVKCFRERHPGVEFDICERDGVGMSDEDDTPAVIITINDQKEQVCILDPRATVDGFESTDPADYGVSEYTADDIRKFNNYALV